MTPDAFRALALELPDAVEGAHGGHPDFRVGGKVFASLAPPSEREPWGMVKLTPEQQAPLLASDPETFRPASGAWGRGGATLVVLRKVRVATARRALAAAWRNTAPKALVRRLDGGA